MTAEVQFGQEFAEQLALIRAQDEQRLREAVEYAHRVVKKGGAEAYYQSMLQPVCWPAVCGALEATVMNLQAKIEALEAEVRTCRDLRSKEEDD